MADASLSISTRDYLLSISWNGGQSHLKATVGQDGLALVSGTDESEENNTTKIRDQTVPTVKSVLPLNLVPKRQYSTVCSLCVPGLNTHFLAIFE